MNVHNALCAIGPALVKVLRRELGRSVVDVGEPVPFERTPTLRLFDALRRGPVQRDVGDLKLDWASFAAHRWRT